ncbi:ATXR2 [Scenedesmus sp. PABB004]|nr:ATXR2 [Scenedesmus sp. PABB004]
MRAALARALAAAAASASRAAGPDAGRLGAAAAALRAAPPAAARRWSSGGAGGGDRQGVVQDLGHAASPVPEELSEARGVNSITAALVAAGDRGDFDQVLRAVEAAGEDFDESAVEAALLQARRGARAQRPRGSAGWRWPHSRAPGAWPQVERCTRGMGAEELRQRIHSTPTFQALTDMAAGGAPGAAPEVLARTIGVLGRLRFDNEIILDELARELMPGVQRLEVGQLAALAQGLRRAQHSPSVLLLDAVHERLARLERDGDGGDARAAGIRDDLRALGHDGRSTAPGARLERLDRPAPPRRRRWRAMGDAYEFAEDGAEELARLAPRLRSGAGRDGLAKALKAIAALLERAPQDVAALGAARRPLEEGLAERAVLGSKHKDVRMYAAVCLAHMLRIYAPDTPYADKELEPVFELLLWSVRQVAEYTAPTFELAVSVLQTTKSHFLLLDMGRKEVVLEWVRVLLASINNGSAALAGPHAMEVLNGLVGDESTNDAVLEALLSHLVPPRSHDNPAACKLAQAVLRACEADVKPQLQKFLTTLVSCPISSNSDLHQQSYALIYQVRAAGGAGGAARPCAATAPPPPTRAAAAAPPPLLWRRAAPQLYQCVPQVLLPVIPHITSELHASEPEKRLEAVQLLCQLFGLPGNRLVAEYGDVLEALLRRYTDTRADVRTVMLESTPTLVAAVADEGVQTKILEAAEVRLRDYDERVRSCAVKHLCQAARRLLLGPAGAAGAAATRANQLALASPAGDLFGSLDSQEADEAAAADLGVAYGGGEPAGGAAAAAAGVRDAPRVQETLMHVSLRLRDTKLAVRKAAASSLIALFRAVAAAAEGDQLARFCALPARVLLCGSKDADLRALLVEGLLRDGLLPQQPPAQAAAAWARTWLAGSDRERDAVLGLLAARAKLQCDALVFLRLRRRLSGKDRQVEGEEAELLRAQLQQAARGLAAQLPHSDKAAEGLTALLAVRDNHAFASLQAALAPDSAAEPAAEAAGQLLLWGRPAAWLPGPVLRELLALASGEPDGEQGELVVPLLFAGLLPELEALLASSDPDLQQLGAQLLAHCAWQLRRRGVQLLAASPDEATAQLVKQQMLPRLRRLCRGHASGGAAPAPGGGGGGKQRQAKAGGGGAKGRAAAGRRGARKRGQADEEGEDEDGAGTAPDALDGGAGCTGCTPKAAKWGVYALAGCLDSAASQAELTALAAELAAGLDEGAPETAARLQALAAVGRLLPGAFGEHVGGLLAFVLDRYLPAYLDATARGAGAGGRCPGGSSSLGGAPASQATPASQAEAAAVGLKAAALRALAAGCVPDADSADVPVSTQRAAARLAQELEGLIDPSDDARPAFLADAPAEAAAELRLAAAGALLRLARRHDARLGAGTYAALALAMQDDLEGVRGAFAAKVYRLVRHFSARPSAHQLSAKYAAMLPLAAMDPAPDNKDAAARMLREWVAHRRAAAAAAATAAAAGGGRARGGGSTLQDQPEMALPYGLYVLAHHPDFPTVRARAGQGAAAAAAAAPLPLQPLRPPRRRRDCDRGAQAEDLADDDAGCCLQPFQWMMQFLLAPLLAPAGGAPAGATAPALAKMCSTIKRTADTAEEPASSQLYTLCDLAAATLAALVERMGLPAEPRAAFPGGVVLPKGMYRPLAEGEAGGADATFLPPRFEGSKRKPAREGSEGAPPAAKRGAAAKRRAKAAADDSDDGWDSDEDAPPSAAKHDQALTRRQQQLQDNKQAAHDRAQRAASGSDSEGGDSDGDAEAPSARPERPHATQQPGRGKPQRQAAPSPGASPAGAGEQAGPAPPAPAEHARARRARQPAPGAPAGGEPGPSPPRNGDAGARPARGRRGGGASGGGDAGAQDDQAADGDAPRAKAGAAAKAAKAAAGAKRAAPAPPPAAPSPRRSVSATTPSITDADAQGSQRGASGMAGGSGSGSGAGGNPLLALVAPDVAREYYAALLAAHPGLEVRLATPGDRGKGVFATRDFAQGEVVFEERPLVAVQELASKLEVSCCAHCFRAVGTVEQHVGGKLCCLISDLSDAAEEADLREVQERVDKIHAAVDSNFLDGLLSGRVRLPLTQHVEMAEPVKCRCECGEEYCSTACEAAAWERCHCLLCPVGEPSGGSSGADAKGKGKAAPPPQQQQRHAGGGASCARGDAGSSSSSGGRGKSGPVHVVHGVRVDRGAMARFLEHADETNDIFRVAAQVIACTLVTADALLQQAAADAAEDGEARRAFAAGLSAAAAGARAARVAAPGGDAPPGGDEQDAVAAAAFARAAGAAAQPGAAAQQVLVAGGGGGGAAAAAFAALQAAFLPFALGHKAPWWDVVEAGGAAGSEAGSDDEDGGSEDSAELRAQLRELAADSLALLRCALVDARFPQLFDVELYGCLVGMFELNNLALALPAPVARYAHALRHPRDAGLPARDAEAALAEVAPLLDALGGAADEPAEGTGFFALQSCLNHSCAPNAAACCDPGGSVAVSALGAIPAGAEVVLSYIDEAGAGLAARRAALRDYGFTCACERCEAEELAEGLGAGARLGDGGGAEA